MSTPAPLTVEKAEGLVRLMTDGLVNIVDTTGEFLMPCEWGGGFCSLVLVVCLGGA